MKGCNVSIWIIYFRLLVLSLVVKIEDVVILTRSCEEIFSKDIVSLGLWLNYDIG